MSRKNEPEKYSALASRLRIDCGRCSGLCCVALYCMKSDGFPADKEAGVPCKNLTEDFRCGIHARLAAQKMRGCLSYDCFGAGQWVTQHFYPDQDWRACPARADDIFTAFLTVFQMHQMLWYLIEAAPLALEADLSSGIESLIWENEQMTAQTPGALLSLDIEQYRVRVNQALKKVCASLADASLPGERRVDFLGKDFQKAKLDGRDFSMSLMIAANLEGCSLRGANFLGADIRGANVRNTDLSACVFLTQMQLNSARGNSHTRIPRRLSRPTGWE